MEDQAYIIESSEKVAEATPWFMDFNTIALIVIAISVICGFVTMAVAITNHRSAFLGFLSGFFLGQLGIAAYMIMGESIEYRIEVEEQIRDKL